MNPAYPATRIEHQTDIYHGIAVSDPYRWLEDANSDETASWVEAENAVTFAYLDTISERDRIKGRLTELWDYEKFGLPSREGDHYFWSKNDGLQNQSVLYVAAGLDAAPRVLLDPNTLSADGTVALAGMAVSDSGKYLAYGLARAGSDWREWRVRDVESGADLPDLVQWAKNSGASWTKDGAGFFYSRYDAPADGAELQAVNYYQKLYYHRLGDAQENDALIYDRPDHKEWGFGGAVTDDGQYLLIYIYEGTERKNRLYVKSLTDENAPVVEVLNDYDAQYGVLDNDGPLFYILTDNHAPRSRVIAVDIHHPQPGNWREILPESAETLQGASLFGDKLYANYLKDARTQIKIFGLDGSPQGEVALPGLGTAGGFNGKRGDKETFYAFSSYTTPTTIFRYDVTTGESSVYQKPTVAFSPDDYETRQIFYPSKDGTRIPLFISHKKGVALDGQNPTYLYGYGGFNVSLTPGFSPTALNFMEMGGIYAVANLRGGGEYGKPWHDAGKLANKQNVFDDFIAAGEWLIANGYTSTPKLAIAGGSNGGLLVGACMTQRPALFGAALPAVGVLDMLRFDKFTIGWMWASDYGKPSENEADFKANFAYSPYHNLKPGTRYPATLITTSDHDDRVVPAHSFKFAAALQAAQAPDGPPVCIRIEKKAGHGAGKPTAKILDEASDVYAFLVKSLGVALPEHYGK